MPTTAPTMGAAMSTPPHPVLPAIGMATASGAAMPRLATALSVTSRASTGCRARSPAAVARSRDEAAQAAPRSPDTGRSGDDEEDDERGDDEGEQVEEQARLGTDERDEPAAEGQAEGLVDLLGHRREAHGPRVEVAVLEEVGQQHHVGRRSTRRRAARARTARGT